MNILIFGATGMVGQAALRECLADPAVRSVLVIGRTATGRQHAKLREFVQPDVTALAALESDLAAVDACLFCLGVSSAGMSEERYSLLTYDLTLAIASTLARVNPDMTFIYVSGTGTDSTAKGRVMWARVKGRTENALLRLPFRAAYMFRPGVIIPLDGIRAKTPWTRILYAMTRPLHGPLRRWLPRHVTTTELIGRAMISTARSGFRSPVLETRDIDEVAHRAPHH